MIEEVTKQLAPPASNMQEFLRTSTDWQRSVDTAYDAADELRVLSPRPLGQGQYDVLAALLDEEADTLKNWIARDGMLDAYNLHEYLFPDVATMTAVLAEEAVGYGTEWRGMALMTFSHFCHECANTLCYWRSASTRKWKITRQFVSQPNNLTAQKFVF